MDLKKFNKILVSYRYTAALSYLCDHGAPHNDPDVRRFGDFTPTSCAVARRDVTTFVEAAGSLLDGIDADVIGYNFWITRNYAGSGFMGEDGIDKRVAAQLSEIAQAFPELDIILSGDLLEFERVSINKIGEL